MTNPFHVTGADWLTILGSISEIVGAIMMANGYLQSTRLRSVLSVLLSALWRGSLARGASVTKELNDEKIAVSLQGIAFITLGFLLQLAATLFY